MSFEEIRPFISGTIGAIIALALLLSSLVHAGDDKFNWFLELLGQVQSSVELPIEITDKEVKVKIEELGIILSQPTMQIAYHGFLGVANRLIAIRTSRSATSPHPSPQHASVLISQDSERIFSETCDSTNK